MKLAYCDCFSGISGDMFLAALVDAGVPLDLLREQIDCMDLAGEARISVDEIFKGPLRAKLINVEVQESHHHRQWADIARMIEDSRLADAVKSAALNIFRVVAEAEGKVHGIPAEQVHFHEVGALDSIVDIVGAAAGLNALGIERLYCSALPYGSGQVMTQHGPLPLPAPATLEILAAAHAPLIPSPAQAEMVTPTGAAIVAALATFQRPDIVLERIGVGAGRKEFPWPNVLRLWVGQSPQDADLPLVLLETNIDDMNPQFYGNLMTRLFKEGARDVFFTPIYMKKNRPATMVSVIARRSEEARLARILLEHTSTLGMRVQPIYRFEAEREFKQVETPYGQVPVKIKILDGKRMQAQPEYDVCLALAEASGVPVADIYAAALSAGRAVL